MANRLWSAYEYGRSRHVQAENTIFPGTLLQKEEPLLEIVASCNPSDLWDPAQSSSNAARNTVVAIHAAIRQLDEGDKAKFQNLYSGPPQARVATNNRLRPRNFHDPADLERVRYNKFCIKNDNDEHVILIYANISFFNHSCRPNAHFYVHQGHGYVRATERINPGEEITICYIPTKGYRNAAARKADCRYIYGFTCSCFACKAESHQSAEVREWLQGSDHRRTTIAGLLNRLQPYSPASRDETPAEYSRRVDAHHNRQGYAAQPHHLVADAQLLATYVKTEQLADWRLVKA